MKLLRSSPHIFVDIISLNAFLQEKNDLGGGGWEICLKEHTPLKSRSICFTLKASYLVEISVWTASVNSS